MDAANYLYTTKASIVISGLVEHRSFIRLRIFAPRLQISIARSSIRGGRGSRRGRGEEVYDVPARVADASRRGTGERRVYRVATPRRRERAGARGRERTRERYATVREKSRLVKPLSEKPAWLLGRPALRSVLHCAPCEAELSNVTSSRSPSRSIRAIHERSILRSRSLL